MRLSGVLYVHNEQDYLPYSLASLYNANLDELIVILDRCTDKSQNIIDRFKPAYPVKIYHKNWQSWKNPIAEVAEYGFSLASGDIIFSLGADVYFDQRMFTSAFFVDYDMVGFRHVNYDLETSRLRSGYETFLATFFRHVDFKGQVWRGGVFGTKRSIWEQLHFRDSPSEYGEHIQFEDYQNRMLKEGWKYQDIQSTCNLHLRDHTLSSYSQLLQGKSRLNLGFPLWKILLHSLLHVKPYVLMGYLRGKQ